MSYIDALRSLIEIIQNPTSNITVAVLLVAALIVFVLMIIMGLLLFMQSGTAAAKPKRAARPVARTARAPAAVDADEYEYPELTPDEVVSRIEAGSAGEPQNRFSRWILGAGAMWIIVGLVAVSVVVGYLSTSRDGYCAQTCHAGTAEVDSRAKDAHKRVACVDCHERPGVAGTMDAMVSRAIHSVANVVPSSAYAEPVTSESCLRCHSDILSVVTTDPILGTRMAHSHPIEAGMTCEDCHPMKGHTETTATVGMSACVRCHDSQIASSDCSTCHMGDTSQATRTTPFSERVFSRIRLVPVSECGGCHSQKSCDECHGTRMPHSKKFVAWEHMKQAGFSKKKMCYGCHTPQDCISSGCHQAFAEQHDVAWPQTHGALGEGTCGCHYLKLPGDAQAEANGNFCKLCHSGR